MLVARQAAGDLRRQGVHWAEAWDELKELAELLAIPVTTSLEGKSAFPETHALSLGSGGLAIPQTVRTFLDKSDLILGIGCSFTETNFGVKMPPGAKIIQATLDPADINKDMPVALGVAGDAKLVLQALIDEVQKLHGKSAEGPQGRRRRDRRHLRALARQVDAEADQRRRAAQPLPRDLGPAEDRRRRQHHHHPRRRQPARPALAVLEADDAALLSSAGARPRSSATASASPWAPSSPSPTSCASTCGATRPSASPAWTSRRPCASASRSCRSCSTTSRMAIELKVMPVSTEKYRSTDISGDYAAMARALGGYGERVEKPADIVPAIKRGIAATEKGQPALLEFITSKEVEVSRL